MKLFKILPSFGCIFLSVTACSPPDAHQETFLDNQRQAIDKAKQVEQLGYEHKKQIDKVERQAK